MKNYRKLIAAVVGVVAIVLGPSVLGVTPGEQFWGLGQDSVVQAVLGILTAVGVYEARNEA